MRPWEKIRVIGTNGKTNGAERNPFEAGIVDKIKKRKKNRRKGK